MSRPRRKNASNVPVPPHEAPSQAAPQFISDDAEKRFREKLCTRPFIPERGFDAPTPVFREKIERMGWQRLCSHPTPGVATVVKEFHANLQDHYNSTCYVRGIWVDFSQATLNQIYHTPGGHSDRFRDFYAEPDYEAVISRLTSRVSCWKRSPKGEIVSFPRGALTEEARVWFYFISSTVLPSKHLCSIYKDKAILVYAILEDMRFDIGAFIHQSIMDSIRGKGAGSLIHPHLITALCRRSGVSIQDQEEKVKAVTPLPMRLVRTAESRATGPSRRDVESDGGEDRVRDSDDEETQPLERPSERAEASVAPHAPAVDTHIMEFLHSISERQEAFHREQREQSERVMGFLQTMKEEHEFELKEQRDVTDRMDQKLGVLFTNQRRAMKNQRDIWDQQNILVGKMSELAVRQEHLYSMANTAITSLTTVLSQDQASRTVFTPPPQYQEPERQRSPRPYRSPER